MLIREGMELTKKTPFHIFGADLTDDMVAHWLVLRMVEITFSRTSRSIFKIFCERIPQSLSPTPEGGGDSYMEQINLVPRV